MTREEIERRMDELARKYVETHDQKIVQELYESARELEKNGEEVKARASIIAPNFYPSDCVQICLRQPINVRTDSTAPGAYHRDTLESQPPRNARQRTGQRADLLPGCRAETTAHFTANSSAIHHPLTCRRQLRTMAQGSVSRLHEGDLPLQDGNGAVRVRKWFVPAVLSRRFTSYVSGQTGLKRLITKQQLARLFSVSMHTIDCWLQDGKLPEPKRTFPRQKWDYEELIARTRLKLTLYR
jgi:hypothetical protein